MQLHTRPGRRFGTTVAIAGTLAAGAMIAPPVTHAAPQGFVEVDAGLGYFYSTFDDDPNIGLLVGGTAEAFCLDAPDDPFGSAEPGMTTQRLFFRADDSLDIKSNSKDEPIYLYEQPDVIGPEWIEQVCDDFFAGEPTPQPFASGTADVKERISVISDDLVDVFNSVNGNATGTDGTEYKVRASADLIVENGMPLGDPADFVSLSLTEIGRG